MPVTLEAAFAAVVFAFALPVAGAALLPRAEAADFLGPALVDRFAVDITVPALSGAVDDADTAVLPPVFELRWVPLVFTVLAAFVLAWSALFVFF
ncbi:MAG: hypothetical protein VCC99_02760 [Alphaproteobacteria bacterium]